MKVLLIGLGSIGRKHVDALLAIDNSVLVYALRRPESKDSYKSVHNIYELDELTNVELDFCIVASPTYKHQEDIEKLLQMHIPLFIEKPLMHSLSIESTVKSIKDKGTVSYVACNLRFLDCISFVKRYLSKNKDLRVNEVNSYCGSYLPDWRAGMDYRESYSADGEQGGGVHLDLIHELDYLYWFFGQPTAVKRTLRSMSSLKIKAIDYANYQLSYDDFMASVILNYYRRDSKRTLELVFEQFTMTIDLLKNTVSTNGEVIFTSDQTIHDTYEAQLNYFIAHIQGGGFNDVEEAYEILKICLPN